MEQAGFTQEQSYFLVGEVEKDMGFRISETYIWILALLHNNYIISSNYFQFVALCFLIRNIVIESQRTTAKNRDNVCIARHQSILGFILNCLIYFFYSNSI